MKTIPNFPRVALLCLGAITCAAQQPQGWITLDGSELPSVQIYEEGAEPPPPPPPNSGGGGMGAASIGNEADVATPEIVELARGLEPDPEKVFAWVRDNIAFTHYYGVVKGAAMTLEERSGNDADTSALMVSLLRQCSTVVSASYVQGFVSLPMSGAAGTCNMADWLGEDANTGLISGVIMNGGTPAEDIYAVNVGGVTHYRWKRWWVRAQIASTVLDYDASFKVHQRTTGLNISTSAQYSKAALRATAGTMNGAALEAAPNTSFENEMKTQAVRLLNYLRTNQPNADAEVLTGAVKMTAYSSNLSGNARFPLVLMSGTEAASSALPTSLMTTVRVQAGNLDLTLKTAELKGQTFWMQLGVRCAVYLGDTLLAEEPADVFTPTVQFVMSLDHPGTISDQSIQPKALPRVGVRTMGYGFTAGTESMLRHQLHLARMRAYYGATAATPRIRAEAQNVMAHAWLLQTEGSTRMLANLNNINHVYKHRFGFVADEHDVATNQGGYYIDFPLQVLAAGPRGTAATDISAFAATNNFISSALEHAVIAQTQAGDAAASAARLIAGTSSAGHPKLLLATSANWPTLKNQTTNYATADTATIEAVLASGGTVLLPANGGQLIQQWAGAGYMTYEPGGSGYRVQALISGGFKGGYSGLVKSISANAVNIMAQSAPRVQNSTASVQRAVTGGDPVNMNSGQFIHESTDLVIGGGVLPRGITFARRYDGTHRFQNIAGMGQGWSHSLNMTISMTSDAESALGRGNALESVAMVLSLYAAHDIFKTRADVIDWSLAVMISNWAANQMIDKAASIRLPDRVLQFHHLPDDTWVAPAGSTAELTRHTLFDFNLGFLGYEFDLQERHGNRWHYDRYGYLAYVEDVFGQRATFNGKSSVTDSQGRTLTLNYNPEGLLTSITDSTGRSVAFAYSGLATSPTLSTVTGATLDPAAFTYDSALRLTHVRNATNQLVVQNTLFDSQDRVIEQVSQNDPARLWRYYYSATQTIEENPLGQRTRHLFDEKKRATGTINALGYASSTVYDKQDRAVSQRSPLGFTNAASYNADHNPTGTTDALGQITTGVYDGQKRVQSVTNSTGQTTTVNSYNTWHQPLSVTDAAGIVTTYTYITFGPAIGSVDTVRVNGVRKSWNVYNAQGLLQQVWQGADGSGILVKSFTYTALGDVSTETELQGSVVYEYNSRRQVTKKKLIPASGSPELVTTYAYNAQGDLVTATNPRGYSVTTQYNVLRKPTLTTAPGGAATSVIYDLADRAVTATDPLSQSITTQYDAAGQAVQVTDPLGHTAASSYDADGRVTSITDALSRITSTTYTARGEVAGTTQPDTHGITQLYDNAGRRTRLTNRSGNAWNFGYDTAGRPITTTSPVGRISRTSYDSEGRVAFSTEPSFQKAGLVYDPVYGRLQKTQYYTSAFASPPSVVIAEVSHTYDDSGNVLTTAEGTATLTRQYTADPRHLTSSYTNAASETFGYQHDANGNQTLLTLPDGKTITYGYDNRDRLTSVTDWAGRVTNIAWDAASRLTSLTRPNGTVRTAFYDAANRLTRIEERTSTGHLIQMVRLGLDAAGRAEKRFTVPLPTAASFPAMSFTYSADGYINGRNYDLDGNLLQVPPVYAPTGQPALGPQPEIRSVTGSTGNATWDTRNRLSTLTLADLSVLSFSYDAENLRLTKTRSGQTTRYTHNPHGLSGMSELTVEHKPDGTKRWYVWGGGLGLLYDVSDTGALRYYHTDQVGSTLALTDPSGTVIGRADYTAYGRITKRTGDTNTPFLYNGAYGVMTDNETGLVHMRARYYHPWMSRFLNADPSGFGGGLNLYAFADGNPILLLDALGLCANSISFRNGDGSMDWGGLGKLAYETVKQVPAYVAENWASSTKRNLTDPRFVMESAAGGFGGAGFAALNRMARNTQVVARAVGRSPIRRAPALEFTGAPLIQGELKTSALLKGDLSTPIFRLAGGDAPVMGRSWTTIDPRSFPTINDFKQAAGIGSWNTGETLIIGRLSSFEGAVGRTALPIDGIARPWVPEIRLNGPAEKMIQVLQTIQLP